MIFELNDTDVTSSHLESVNLLLHITSMCMQTQEQYVNMTAVQQTENITFASLNSFNQEVSPVVDVT